MRLAVNIGKPHFYLNVHIVTGFILLIVSHTYIFTVVSFLKVSSAVTGLPLLLISCSFRIDTPVSIPFSL